MASGKETSCIPAPQEDIRENREGADLDHAIGGLVQTGALNSSDQESIWIPAMER